MAHISYKNVKVAKFKETLQYDDGPKEIERKELVASAKTLGEPSIGLSDDDVFHTTVGVELTFVDGKTKHFQLVTMTKEKFDSYDDDAALLKDILADNFGIV